MMRWNGVSSIIEMQDAIVMRIDNHVRYVTMAKKSLQKKKKEKKNRD